MVCGTRQPHKPCEPTPLLNSTGPVLRPEQGIVFIGAATPPSARGSEHCIQCASTQNAPLESLLYRVNGRAQTFHSNDALAREAQRGRRPISFPRSAQRRTAGHMLKTTRP
jgi:hypothetical protein